MVLRADVRTLFACPGGLSDTCTPLSMDLPPELPIIAEVGPATTAQVWRFGRGRGVPKGKKGKCPPALVGLDWLRIDVRWRLSNSGSGVTRNRGRGGGFKKKKENNPPKGPDWEAKHLGGRFAAHQIGARQTGPSVALATGCWGINSFRVSIAAQNGKQQNLLPQEHD